MRRICVTGGHVFKDFGLVFEVLSKMLRNYPKEEVTLVQGGAKGVDKFARIWAEDNDYRVETHEAEWNKFGKAAGPIRNEYMLNLGIDVLIVFPGGNGTAHMKKICIQWNKDHPDNSIYIYDVKKEYQFSGENQSADEVPPVNNEELTINDFLFTNEMIKSLKHAIGQDSRWLDSLAAIKNP